MKYNRHLKKWLPLLLSLLILLTSCVPAAMAADDFDRLMEQGAAFWAEEDYESASMCYEIAVKLSPDDVAALKGYAQALMSLSRHDEAMAYLNHAVAISPADPSVYLMRCEIYLRNGDAASAAKDVRYAELCGGEIPPDLYARIGQALSAGGNDSTALDAFEKAGDDALSDAYVASYKRTLIRTGNMDKAEALNLLQPIQKDEQLSAAMASDATFRLISEPIDLLNCPVFCSAYFWSQNEADATSEGVHGAITEDGKRYKIYDTLNAAFDGDASPLAISPDGDTCLFAVDQALAIYRNGELTMVTPNPERSPEDQGKNQLERLGYNLGRYLEQDGVAWSPNGRYAALTFPGLSLVRMQFLDLMLIDLESGDLFLCESTPAKIMDGATTALYALFDSNSTSLFYVAYGNVGDDGRAALKRYDIEDGTAETLIVSPDFLAWPGLFMDNSGALRCLIDVRTLDEQCGIMHFFPTENHWGADAEYFYASESARLQYPKRMQYSSNSGLTLLTCRFQLEDLSMSYISVLDDEDMDATQSTAVMLPANGGKTAQRVKIDQNLASAPTGTANPSLPPWREILNSAISPDGYYALLITHTADRFSLQLLDMQTLALADVQLPAGTTLDSYRATVKYLSLNALQWIDGNRVLMHTAEGNAIFTLSWN